MFILHPDGILTYIKQKLYGNVGTSDHTGASGLAGLGAKAGERLMTDELNGVGRR